MKYASRGLSTIAELFLFVSIFHLLVFIQACGILSLLIANCFYDEYFFCLPCYRCGNHRQRHAAFIVINIKSSQFTKSCKDDSQN